MNTEIWLEDMDDNLETIKLTGETASNFIVPQIGADVGAWQDEHVQGTGTYVLLTVHAIRHYVFKQENKTGLPIWVQEIHVMCSNRSLRGRR